MLAISALLISAAALTVACASVYLNNLAPAAITLDPVRRDPRDELPTGGYSPEPQSHDLWLAFFLSNTGARGGLLEAVEVAAADNQPEGQRYWESVDRTEGPLAQQNPGAPRLGVLALEAGDARTIWLWVHLQPPALGPEQGARRIRGLETVWVAVTWRFIRTRPLRRHKRQTISRSTTLTVDASHYREHAVAYWRSLGQTAHLADIAEGKAEAPPA